MTRYRDDIARDLYTVRRQLEADRRRLDGARHGEADRAATERAAANRAIRERGIRALQNKIAALDAEHAAAAERPRHARGDMPPPPGCTWARDTSYRKTPFSQAEIDAARDDHSLDIPDFLKRAE